MRPEKAERGSLRVLGLVVCLTAASVVSAVPRRGTRAESVRPAPAGRDDQRTFLASLDPLGKLHIPIGIPNTVDTLKTFVEAEGSFSPGFATFGVYAWVRDSDGRLHSPTQSESECAHGLADGGRLVPWSEWNAGPVKVRTEVCQTRQSSPGGDLQVAATRVELANPSDALRRVSLFLVIRPLGPAGWPIKAMEVDGRDALRVDGHSALVADRKPEAIGVAGEDGVGQAALEGQVPGQSSATSDNGECSGSMRFDFDLPPGGRVLVGAVCPVLAGRRGVGHSWVPGGSNDNFREAAVYDAPTGGVLQPDPGPGWLRSLKVEALFVQALSYWQGMAGRARLSLPDRRWGDGFAAMAGHIAMNLNEDAPDVAVVNYTTFNRDGMYNTEVLHRAGMFGLAEKAIDYLYAHPFNGRVYPEADNPGQILWVTGQHWLFTRDTAWLKRILPKVKQLAALIRYCRTEPMPHWVDMNGLVFGGNVAVERRRELVPGRCDGSNPNYTEAYDVAGLWAAAMLCEASGEPGEAAGWKTMAEKLMADYDGKYGSNLPKDYGSFCVLWPCRLYPPAEGKAHDQFIGIGKTGLDDWPYFGPARAHQGLLAGNREAGFGTLDVHLDHPKMRGWYAFDENGESGEGGWMAPLRTRWTKTSAMPHGWAIAEVVLLLRDSLAFEDGDRLVLFGGVPEKWFKDKDGMTVDDLPTHFGELGFSYRFRNGEGVLEFTGNASPPAGFTLRLPESVAAVVGADQRVIRPSASGDAKLPPGTRRVTIRFSD
jgi:hypothetical protein